MMMGDYRVSREIEVMSRNVIAGSRFHNLEQDSVRDEKLSFLRKVAAEKRHVC